MPTPTPQQMLDAYLQAEIDVLAGKSVRIGDRMFTHEDLPALRTGRLEWQNKVSGIAAAAAGAPRFGGLGYSLARLD